MIDEKIAKQMLLTDAGKRNFIFEKWMGKPFQFFKLMSTTEKGDIGEDFLASLLKKRKARSLRCRCAILEKKGRFRGKSRNTGYKRFVSI